jgi:PAS domain S-box-containing protein
MGEEKTKEQLLNELAELRQYISELEKSENKVKQMEKALQEDHNELEIRVQERTADLVKANEALQKEIIERKHAEAVLKDSEKKFAAAFYKSPIPMAITAMKDGRYIDVNEPFLNIMGLKYEQLVGNSSTGAGFITGESRALFLEEYRQKGFVENLELPMQVKNGECRRGLFNSSKITIGDEDFFLTMVTDITELRRVEEELRKSEVMLSSVFKAAPIGLCVMKNRVYQFANTAWCEQFGYSESDLIGHTTRFLYENKEEYVRIGQELNATLSTKSLASVSTRLQRKDCALRDVNLTAVPLQREDLSQGLIVAIEDVTDRKRAEQELIWKTALLEAQVEATIDGILIVDGEGKRILVNQRLLDIWKVPQHIRDDEDDTPLLQYVTSITKYPDQFLKKVLYLYDHPAETSRDEIEFKDGMVLDRYSSPVLGKDGKYYGRIWTFRDVTDHKWAEQERLRMEKLQGILEMAGTICHEMNQPMQIISGYSEMLLNLSENHKIHAKLNTINEQIQRMGDITKKLMKIENFETQDYAGFSRIININKISGNDNE